MLFACVYTLLCVFELLSGLLLAWICNILAKEGSDSNRFSFSVYLRIYLFHLSFLKDTLLEIRFLVDSCFFSFLFSTFLFPFSTLNVASCCLVASGVSNKKPAIFLLGHISTKWVTFLCCFQDFLLVFIFIELLMRGAA